MHSNLLRQVLLDSLKRKTYDDELRREELLNYIRRLQTTSQKVLYSVSLFFFFLLPADIESNIVHYTWLNSVNVRWNKLWLKNVNTERVHRATLLSKCVDIVSQLLSCERKTGFHLTFEKCRSSPLGDLLGALRSQDPFQFLREAD